MKSFLKKNLFFLILLITGAFLLDFVVGKGLGKTGTGEFQTWNDIFQSRINSDIIISGSSRAWTHINPEILDSVLCVNSYNIGINGYPFNMQYVRFNIYIKYNRKPKLVIQNVDFRTLNVRRDAFNKEQFLPYVHEDILKSELKQIGFTDYELSYPALRYRSEMAALQGIWEFFNVLHCPGIRYKGYKGAEESWDGSAFEKILAGKDSIAAQCEPEMVQLLDTFLRNCKEDDIQVILVFTPEYIKATDFTADKEKVMQIYRSFSEKYNIPFLDYTHDSICYDTTYFYNATHLNKKGAELFSLKLANDIKNKSSISLLNRIFKTFFLFYCFFVIEFTQL
jgi:hypothetical protein